MRHDQRRGTGDGNKANLQILLFDLALLLGDGLQTGYRQHAGDSRHRGAATDCTQKAPAHLVLRKQGLDQGGLNEIIAVGLKLSALTALAQFLSRCLRLHCLLVGLLAFMTAATATHQKRFVRVIGVKVGTHGSPRIKNQRGDSKLRARPKSALAPHLRTKSLQDHRAGQHQRTKTVHHHPMGAGDGTNLDRASKSRIISAI